MGNNLKERFSLFLLVLGLITFIIKRKKTTAALNFSWHVCNTLQIYTEVDTGGAKCNEKNV